MRLTIPTRAHLGAVALVAALAVVSVGSPARALPGTKGGGTLAQELRRTLLLFPADVASSVPSAVKDDVAGIVTDVAASRLGASGAYSVIRYSRALPTVARLHMDQLLTDTDVQPPFSEDNRKPIKIGKEAGYDTAFVGSVDSYEYSDADKQVTMILSGRILEVQTSKVLRSAIVTVSSPKGGTGKENEIALTTARSAAEQLMGKLVPAGSIVTTPSTTPNRAPANEPSRRRRVRTDWLWGVLAVGLGLGIGLASSGGGHGGGSTSGGGGDGGPPPPP